MSGQKLVFIFHVVSETQESKRENVWICSQNKMKFTSETNLNKYASKSFHFRLKFDSVIKSSIDSFWFRLKIMIVLNHFS